MQVFGGQRGRTTEQFAVVSASYDVQSFALAQALAGIPSPNSDGALRIAAIPARNEYMQEGPEFLSQGLPKGYAYCRSPGHPPVPFGRRFLALTEQMGSVSPCSTTEAIRAQGFDGYARGHFGHGLGTGPGSEEWPFIAADSDTCITPGMVLAFECPWYITGLGGFIIEDQIEITETGPVSMNRLQRGLVSL